MSGNKYRYYCLVRFSDACSVLGGMPTLAVGMFYREKRRMATQAWPWHPLYLCWKRSSRERAPTEGWSAIAFERLGGMPTLAVGMFYREKRLGGMPTLAVGMFYREKRRMATQAWPWHPLYLCWKRSSRERAPTEGWSASAFEGFHATLFTPETQLIDGLLSVNFSSRRESARESDPEAEEN